MPNPITTQMQASSFPSHNPIERPGHDCVTEMQASQEVMLEENIALALQEIEQGRYAIMNDEFWQSVETKVRANLN